MTESSVRIPADQAKLLRTAFKDFTAALDPADQWAGRRLASVINAAHAAGWSWRTVASALGISRERTLKLSQYKPSLRCTVDQYRPGTTFPESALATFRRIERDIDARRREAETRMATLIRSAHGSGWPFHLIGQEVGATGEWIRQIGELHPDAGQAPESFDQYKRPLKGRPAPNPRGKLTEAERKKLRQLAAIARGNTKSTERTREEREASEQLSALIIEAKGRRITWDDLDEACGYRRGSARARAVRHGYGKLPPSMKRYSPAKKPSNV